jgi:hypothetical protein
LRWEKALAKIENSPRLRKMMSAYSSQSRLAGRLIVARRFNGGAWNRNKPESRFSGTAEGFRLPILTLPSVASKMRRNFHLTVDPQRNADDVSVVPLKRDCNFYFHHLPAVETAGYYQSSRCAGLEPDERKPLLFSEKCRNSREVRA